MTPGSRPFGLDQVIVCPGSLLLAQADNADWERHRQRLGPVPRRSRAELIAWSRQVDLRGRGGAAFPFATKLAAISVRRPAVVINGTESEPASAKDAILLARAPHLVLDGAAVLAQALGATEIQVAACSRPEVTRAITAAIRQRNQGGEKLRWQLYRGSERFVGGHSSAVVELISGREDLPVTSWEPSARRGYQGRPTLLSNVETFAQVAALARIGPDAYAAHGHPGNPGTLLVTVDGDSPAPYVVEVPGGTSLTELIGPRWTPGAAVLFGGYHGRWVPATELPFTRVSHHPPLLPTAIHPNPGAGVVLLLTAATCPVRYTDHLARYLAAQSAGQCGPCRFGLPALARQVTGLADGRNTISEIQRLTSVVAGRGACAHPDGTVAMVASLFAAFPTEVAAHAAGRCAWSGST